MNRKSIAGATQVLAITLGVVWQPLFATDGDIPKPTRLEVNAACDSAQRPCVGRATEFVVELRLGPPVRPMEQFHVQLQKTNGDIPAEAQVAVQFDMVGMEMGMNRYVLEKEGDGRWNGRAILPVCSSGRSDWIARVEIVADGRLWVAEFPFTMADLR